MRDDLPEHLRDEAVFDRLADGELSLEETRSLLRSLDERPDGWRRCALAFLEAQAWSQELQKLFVKANVDSISVSTGTSYIMPLIQFFKRREKRMSF